VQGAKAICLYWERRGNKKANQKENEKGSEKNGKFAGINPVSGPTYLYACKHHGTYDYSLMPRGLFFPMKKPLGSPAALSAMANLGRKLCVPGFLLVCLFVC